ncbi:MAG: hypothetical protein GY754_45740 [bacterium]|nr:hypothetical protein [bacterium]
MYYRYKSKKKKRGPAKIVVAMILLMSVAALGYRYQQYLLFWKYTNNKLAQEINRVNGIKDAGKRQEGLVELVESMNHYKSENQVEAEAFFLSGKVHSLLGESYLSGTFSKLLIDGRLKEKNRKAEKEFYKTIKNIRKGLALIDGGALKDEYSMALARACYYTGFNNPEEIYQVLRDAKAGENLENVEDIRFYSIVCITNDKVDEGLEYLTGKGMVNESMQGRLFLAASQKIAKRYTNSIMNYKEVLTRTSDNEILKQVHLNLGQIYFNRSLYKESLVHFSNALKIDERDNLLKIWIGKNYSALGDKDRARAIWSEVMASDSANDEVRKLLNVM